MGQVQRRKQNVAKNKMYQKKRRTRNFSKDIDQIYEDVNDAKRTKMLTNQTPSEDLPGMGQYYCLTCAKYFTNEPSLQDHLKTKVHKRNIKKLQEKPYTQKDSDEYGK